MGDRQAEVIAFLSDPATHGGAPVEVIETHAALVFLAGASAYKMKRAVRYDYLDFSALEARREMLERELDLNGPVAPEIYRDVIAVTEGPAGLRLGGLGAAVEWVLCMARFDTENELSQIARRGALDVPMAFELGRVVAGLHRAAPVRTEDGAALIGEIVDELSVAFDGMRDTLGLTDPDALTHSLWLAHKLHAPLLSRRGAEGHVRRCHGDLHLGNIVLIGGRPVPFDALEFDERLGTCDVLYDLAFLLMDLRHRNLRDRANATLNAWALSMGGAEDAGLAALPLFLAVRAGIRAMVLVQTDRASNHAGRATAEARAYLREALEMLRPSQPRLVAFGGRSGTGKTTMARRVAPWLGVSVGALHLSSDLERKTMLGVHPLAHLPPEAYTPEMTDRLYARLLRRAGQALSAGMDVVLDATFLGDAQRAAIAALAQGRGMRFEGIWLEAPQDDLARRVAVRANDASDADLAVLAQQIAPVDPGPGWAQVDASGSEAAVAARVAAALGLPR